jgi:hypothetical protein
MSSKETDFVISRTDTRGRDLVGHLLLNPLEKRLSFQGDPRLSIATAGGSTAGCDAARSRPKGPVASRFEDTRDACCARSLVAVVGAIGRPGVG